jgi:O-antigen/teichoic acid export membrane protein
MTSALKRGVVSMTAANAVALAMVLFGYILYSRFMTPAEFGIYAGALAIAKLGTTVLDGGLKITLVKHNEVASPGILRTLFICSTGASILAVLLLTTIVFTLSALNLLESDNALFFTLYSAAYFLTYPFLFIPLAQLERQQHFTPVARAEMLSVSIEYALPALLWLLVAPGFWSFILAVWIARALRASLVLFASKDRAWLLRRSVPQWQASKSLLREGLGLQIAVSLGMLRDNIHLLLVGPWFGKEWAGLYAWALQLCAVASQVFVQTAARVALPALRLTQGMDSRWKTTLTQIAWLTIFTAPPLVFLTDIARVANEELFESKWTAALILLPFIIVRMLPGLATTPLGSLVLAERDARTYAAVNAWWTGSEVVVAATLLWLYGPIGLAWSYAFMGWLGVAAFVRQLPLPARFISLLSPLLLRPSLWGAVALVLVYRWGVVHLGLGSNLMAVLFYGAIGTLTCIAIERRCWRTLLPSTFKRAPVE